MKFCQPHWDELRAALDERGLSHLIAKDGKQAVKNLAAELTEGRSVENYDPLMAAHNAILNNVMGVVGIEVMYPNEDGSDRCPLCFLTTEHKAGCKDPTCEIDSYDDWIDRAADDQLSYWSGVAAPEENE